MMRDGHHVLFERRLWESNQPNKELRGKHGLIVNLDRDAHEELHRNVAMVPPFNYVFGRQVLNLYRDNPDDHIRSIHNLMRSTQEAMKHPRMSDLERSLGGLVMQSLELQLPFIREGAIDPYLDISA